MLKEAGLIFFCRLENSDPGPFRSFARLFVGSFIKFTLFHLLYSRSTFTSTALANPTQHKPSEKLIAMVYMVWEDLKTCVGGDRDWLSLK